MAAKQKILIVDDDNGFASQTRRIYGSKTENFNC